MKPPTSLHSVKAKEKVGEVVKYPTCDLSRLYLHFYGKHHPIFLVMEMKASPLLDHIQGVFFNWPPDEFAKCWPVSN